MLDTSVDEDMQTEPLYEVNKRSPDFATVVLDPEPDTVPEEHGGGPTDPADELDDDEVPLIGVPRTMPDPTITF